MSGSQRHQMNFRGLVTNPNELAITGDGAMRQFVNGALTRPALAQSRRGIEYLTQDLTRAINKFFVYDGGLLVHAGSGSTGRICTLSGSTLTAIGTELNPVSGRLRSCISGKNFYTAGTVPKRLSGVTSTPKAAGGLFAPGFDPAFTQLPTGTMLEAARAVAYRYVFGLTDEKENLHLGEVSGRLVVINDSASTANPKIRALVPSTATTSHFIQFYRSAKVAVDAVDGRYHPDDDLQLVFEQQLKTTDIAAGYVELTDITPGPTLVGGNNVGIDLRGAVIYTAPALFSDDFAGINASNRAPPGCLEICSHKTRTWFGNTVQPGEFLFDIIAVGGSEGIQEGDILKFTGITNPFSMTAVQSFQTVLGRTGTTTVTAFTYGAHGFIVGDYIYITSGNSNFGQGPFQVATTPDTVTYTYVDATSSGTSSLEGQYVHKTTVSGPANGIYVALTDTNSGSVSARVHRTAQNFVAAFNKHSTNTELWAQYTSGDSDLAASIYIRGRTPATFSFFVSSGAGSKRDCFSPQLMPSEHTVNLSRTSNVVTATVTSGTQSFKVGEQVLIGPGGPGSGTSDFGVGPHTITAIDVTGPSTTFTYSETEDNGTLNAQSATLTPQDVGAASEEIRPNRVYYSKSGEHEATTRTGWIDVGDATSAIKVMLSQRGQIWVWKTDGIYRILGGDDPAVVPQDLRVEALDASIKLLATETVVLFSNRCWGLTDRGVVAVSESGLDIMSSAITDDLRRAKRTVDYVSTVTWEPACFATAYESDHCYILHIPAVFDRAGNTVGDGFSQDCLFAYVFNTESSSWSLWDWGQASDGGVHNLKRAAIVSPDSLLYLGDGIDLVAGNGAIFRERKDLTEKDYRDSTGHRDVVSLTSNGTNTITATCAGGVLRFAVGDRLLITPGDATFQGTPITQAAGFYTVLTVNVGAGTFTYLQPAVAATATLAGQMAVLETGVAKTWSWILQTDSAPAKEKRWDELAFIFGQRGTFYPSAPANSQRAFNLALANETASVAAFAVATQGTQTARVWVDAEVARGSRLLVTLTHSTIDEAFDLSGIAITAEALDGAVSR